MKTLNGELITTQLLDKLEQNNFFGGDDSEDIRFAWEGIINNHHESDISDDLATELLGDACSQVYCFDLGDIGSAAVSMAYESNPNVRFRFVTSNFLEADKKVILYQDNTEFENYFATTNGDPIFQEEFKNVDCFNLQEASDYVAGIGN